MNLSRGEFASGKEHLTYPPTTPDHVLPAHTTAPLPRRRTQVRVTQVRVDGRLKRAS